ncbi:hypothetical protein [Streptomyces sp. NBC_01643]|uniref:hypothetical protein n=1 Tax=Streptomyces sp. NBC_01643 TaxID=2975906 RepID=UPI002F90F84C|nr:hypothetical protein OHB03_48035 [Streptomyces sp. NBC_01643]
MSGIGTPGGATEELILTTLRRARHQALSGAELAAAARNSGIGNDEYEHALNSLEQSGRVIVVSHPSPDAHLNSVDLRTIGIAEEASPEALARARRSADACWDDFLRAFLAAHRCG